MKFRSGRFSSRRDFLRVAGLGGAVSAAAGAATPAKKSEEEEVAPAEDLMREHGVLNRILLIYEEALRRLGEPHPDLDPSPLSEAAMVVRDFIEAYHEKLEEDHLFPRFEKADVHAGLVCVLRQQHGAGRTLTDRIIRLATLKTIRSAPDRNSLAANMRAFIRMYRPHESREDTVLFPALRRVVSRHEYDSLGEDFEKEEHRRFGADGFERIVARVGSLEKSLGIFDLSQFTPKTEEQTK